MKKWIAMALACLLALSLVACDPPKPTDSNNSELRKQFGVQDGDPFEFSLTTKTADDYKGTETWEAWEELCNIDVEYIPRNGASYDEWFTLAMGTGELADVVNMPTDTLTARLAAESGAAFWDITDMVNEYGKNYLYQLQQEPFLYQNLLSDSGRLYNIVKIQKPTFSKSEWINNTFLQQLNMQDQIPTNTDQLLEYLRKVKTNISSQDPNIWPYAEVRSYLDNTIMQELHHWFRLRLQTDQKPGWLYDGEKMTNDLFMKSAREKELYTYAHTLYQEALIPPDWQLFDDVTGSNRGYNNQTGFFYTYVANSARYLKERTNGRNDYIVIQPMKGPGGSKPYAGRQFPGAGGTFFISKNCKEPEKVVKALDFWYSQYGIDLANWGPMKYRTKNEDGSWNYGPEYFKAAGNVSGPMDPAFMPGQINKVIGIIPAMMTNVTLAERQYAVAHSSLKQYEEWSKPYYLPWTPNLSFTPEEIIEMNGINEQINAKMAGIDLKKFVTGELSLDTWDVIPTAFQNNGGPRLAEIYNQALLRWEKRTKYMIPAAK